MSDKSDLADLVECLEWLGERIRSARDGITMCNPVLIDQAVNTINGLLDAGDTLADTLSDRAHCPCDDRCECGVMAALAGWRQRTVGTLTRVS